MNIAIVGFGNEGKTLLAFLKKSPRYKQAVITVLDKNEMLTVELKRQKIPYELGADYLKNLKRFDLIFRSPGIPYLLPEIQTARIQGTHISSQTKLFFEELMATRRAAKSAKPLIIGVTGTKGKGTTSTLIFQMLKNAKYKTILAGNIGTPMIEALATAKRADYVVLELSSFQLQDMDVSPDIAVVVDIFPDHLDSHKDTREYYTAKANIGRFQKKSGRIFFYATNTLSTRIAAKSPARKHGITPKQDNLRKNFEMAAAVARTCGCSNTIIERTIKKFTGLEHRLELVKKIRSITFYNDSAGTNPVATAAAILSFKEPIVLIAGGKDKGFSYAPLGVALKKSTVQHVVLFGENREKIAHDIQTAKRTVTMANTLKDAITIAFARAKELAAQKESAVIVFSPAAASFDMFANYRERGLMYKKTVNALR